MGPDLFDLHARVEAEHWWFAGRRMIMRRLVSRTAPPRDAVVDVGCGTGANIAALASNYPVIGIDTSSEALRHARAHFPGVSFIQGSADTALTAISERVGCVLVMDVLEHVSDDFGLLASVLEPLAIGSQVLVTVPADMRLWSAHDVAFQHYRRYDPARLSAVWEQQPVRVRLMSPFCSRLYWPIRAVRAARNRLNRGNRAPQSDLGIPPMGINGPLSRIFATEAAPLARAVDSGTAPFAHGSSLIAILERQDGPVLKRGKPARYAVDPHDPWPGRSP